MKEFQYTIKDSCGIHARPAGLLAKMAKNYGGTAKLSCNGKDCEIKKLMALMSMGVKRGETVTVSVEGEGDAAFAAELEKFFKENL